MNRNFLTSIGVCVLTAVIVVGCGPRSPFPTQPIEGTVTLDGQPLDDASIALSPVADETPDAKPAFGQSDAQGKFKITAANGGLEGKGTAVGKYVVCVTKEVGTTHLTDEQIKELNDKGIPVQLVFKSVVPKKYTSPATTDLAFEVVKGKNVLNIDLKSE